jgi:hypothetical protein
MYSVRGDSFIGSTLGSCDRLSAGAPRTEVTYPMSVFGSESAELSPCVTPPAERASRKRTEKSKQGVECDDRAPRRRTLPSRSYSESNCVIRRVSDRLATENSPCSTASRGTRTGDWCTRSGRPPASGGRPSRRSVRCVAHAGQHDVEAVEVCTRIAPLLVQPLEDLVPPRGPASDWRSCSSVFAHGGPEAVVLVTEEQPAEDAGDSSTDRRPA